MKTGAELTTEVKAVVGRPDDTELITDSFAVDKINDAQREISEKCVCIESLVFKNTGSLTFVTDQVEYAIGDISVNDVTATGPAYIYNVWYINGAQSNKLSFLPTDEFDLQWPDPTSSEVSAMKPRVWTRRGQNIEIAPRPSSDYNGDTMRVDGMSFAADFTVGSTSMSDISRADEGIVRHAVAECYAAMGKPQVTNAMYWQKRFDEWYETFQNRQSSMMAWDDNVFFDQRGSYGSGGFGDGY